MWHEKESTDAASHHTLLSMPCYVWRKNTRVLVVTYRSPIARSGTNRTADIHSRYMARPEYTGLRLFPFFILFQQTWPTVCLSSLSSHNSAAHPTIGELQFNQQEINAQHSWSLPERRKLVLASVHDFSLQATTVYLVENIPAGTARRRRFLLFHSTRHHRGVLRRSHSGRSFDNSFLGGVRGHRLKRWTGADDSARTTLAATVGSTKLDKAIQPNNILPVSATAYESTRRTYFTKSRQRSANGLGKFSLHNGVSRGGQQIAIFLYIYTIPQRGCCERLVRRLPLFTVLVSLDRNPHPYVSPISREFRGSFSLQ